MAARSARARLRKRSNARDAGSGSLNMNRKRTKHPMRGSAPPAWQTKARHGENPLPRSLGKGKDLSRSVAIEVVDDDPLQIVHEQIDILAEEDEIEDEGERAAAILTVLHGGIGMGIHHEQFSELRLREAEALACLAEVFGEMGAQGTVTTLLHGDSFLSHIGTAIYVAYRIYDVCAVSSTKFFAERQIFYLPRQLPCGLWVF